MTFSHHTLKTHCLLLPIYLSMPCNSGVVSQVAAQPREVSATVWHGAGSPDVWGVWRQLLLWLSMSHSITPVSHRIHWPLLSNGKKRGEMCWGVFQSEWKLVKALTVGAWDLAKVLKRPEPHFSVSFSLLHWLSGWFLTRYFVTQSPLLFKDDGDSPPW